MQVEQDDKKKSDYCHQSLINCTMSIPKLILFEKIHIDDENEGFELSMSSLGPNASRVCCSDPPSPKSSVSRWMMDDKLDNSVSSIFENISRSSGSCRSQRSTSSRRMDFTPSVQQHISRSSSSSPLRPPSSNTGAKVVKQEEVKGDMLSIGGDAIPRQPHRQSSLIALLATSEHTESSNFSF